MFSPVYDRARIMATAPAGKTTNPLLMKGPSGFRPAEFYAKCMFGGVLACGVTHASVVTLDVAKCRTQAHSKSGAWPNGLVSSISKTWEGEGVRGITKGWVPTFFGYGAQGLFKFGLNEFFKDFYTNLVGQDTIDQSTVKRMILWAAASGSAEIFADAALCPFEMTKVKMQVTLPGQPGGVPNSMVPAMREMARNSAETKFPFGSLVPLWGRQVPYTMIKFVGFYQTQNMVYDQLEKRTGKKKSDFGDATQLAITFGCGYWAGIFCAIATQPMDNLVSMKGIPENKNKPWGQMASEMGAKDLFVKGLSTRIIMIGTLTGLQWWIYGSFKNAMGFGTS
jgi:solute carrier family 25 phosphate transporter 3